MSKDINGNRISRGRYIVYPRQYDHDSENTTLFKVLKSKGIWEVDNTPLLEIKSVHHFGRPSPWCIRLHEVVTMNGDPLLVPIALTSPELDIESIKLYLKLSNINIGE